MMFHLMKLAIVLILSSATVQMKKELSRNFTRPNTPPRELHARRLLMPHNKDGNWSDHRSLASNWTYQTLHFLAY